MSEKKASAERYLRESLMQDEHILWEGRSARFRLLEGSDGKKVAQSITATIAITAILIGFYVTDTPDVQVGFIAVLLLIMMGIVISPIIAWKQLLRQRYWITNRRILTIRGNLLEAEMFLDDVDEIASYPLRPGVGSLSLGSSVVSEGTHQLRWRSIHPLEVRPSHTVGLVLYGLENADAVAATLSSLTGVQAA